MKIILAFFLTLIVSFSCSTKVSTTEVKTKNNWPTEITSLPKGLEVINTPSLIYAKLNQKDSLKYRYKLAFETEVRALYEDLEIVDFGGYIWKENKWVFQTMYGRPFNKDEFIRWYGSINGEILLDSIYADRENWLTKTNYLDESSIRFLNYFIAKNSKGEKFYGAAEVIGHSKMK